MRTTTVEEVAGTGSDDLLVVVVDVGGVRCGLPAADVVELHPVVASVALPGAPAVVDGAIDVRGSVVAVLDVRTRLGLPRREPVLTDHLVVSRVGGRTVALRVDRAVDLTAVPRTWVHSADDLPGLRHVSGVARLPDGLLLIHDLASFLSPDEAVALDGALAGFGEEPGEHG